MPSAAQVPRVIPAGSWPAVNRSQGSPAGPRAATADTATQTAPSPAVTIRVSSAAAPQVQSCPAASVSASPSHSLKRLLQSCSSRLSAARDVCEADGASWHCDRPHRAYRGRDPRVGAGLGTVQMPVCGLALLLCIVRQRDRRACLACKQAAAGGGAGGAAQLPAADSEMDVHLDDLVGFGRDRSGGLPSTASPFAAAAAGGEGAAVGGAGSAEGGGEPPRSMWADVAVRHQGCSQGE